MLKIAGRILIITLVGLGISFSMYALAQNNTVRAFITGSGVTGDRGGEGRAGLTLAAPRSQQERPQNGNGFQQRGGNGFGDRELSFGGLLSPRAIAGLIRDIAVIALVTLIVVAIGRLYKRFIHTKGTKRRSQSGSAPSTGE